MAGWLAGWLDGWMDGWVDGWKKGNQIISITFWGPNILTN